MHWFWLAKASFILGERLESIEAAFQCASIQPDDLEACILYAHICLETEASSYHHQKSYDMLLKHTVRHKPQNTMITYLLKLGVSLGDEAKTIQALKVVQNDSLHIDALMMSELNSIESKIESKGLLDAHSLIKNILASA